MAWIETIAPESATGRLGRIYAQAMERAGRVFGIVRLMSLEPTTLQASMGLYAATTTNPESAIPRWFRELVAVEVSKENDCFY